MNKNKPYNILTKKKLAEEKALSSKRKGCLNAAGLTFKTPIFEKKPTKL